MTTTYAFCEPVWATTWTRIHIRDLEGKGLKLGGGIDTPTLCGRLAHYGWDLEEEVTEAAIDARLNTEVGPTCPDCAQAWCEAQPGYAAPFPPRIQGYHPTRMILDELADPF